MTGGKSITNEQIEKLRRVAYVSGKGIDPKESFQLDLLFPQVQPDDTRVIPNDYARSSLFTARNKREPRAVLQREKLFHLHEGQGVSILFTGIELRAEDDEIVWLQILHYAKSVPLGEPFEFSVKDLVRDMGWPKNGRYYEKARECISRLKASEVLVHNEKAYGSSGAISLIDRYTVVNDQKGSPTHYRVLIDKNLIVLFAGSTFTNHSWIAYRSLSPVARRLADYIESHRAPFPLNLERFGEMCGSKDRNAKSWNQTVRKACAELEEVGIAKQAKVQNGFVYTVR